MNVERECLILLSDAIVDFIYDERLYVNDIRSYNGSEGSDSLFAVAIVLNHRAAGALGLTP